MITETRKVLAEIEKRFQSVKSKLSLEDKKQKALVLETETSKTDFWLDRHKAEEILKKLGDIKNEIEEIDGLEGNIKSLKELLSAGVGDSPSDQKVIQQEVEELSRKIDKLELKTFLSGRFDRSDAIVSIHAGQGGTEACDWAEMLKRMYLRYAESKKWKTEIADERSGEEAGIKRITFFVKGSYAYGYLKKEKGTHRLVRLSPYNANNLRQTSFALVEVIPVVKEDNEEASINPKDLEIDFFRSSGHGGQNVNKVSTAVRIKHIPSGIIVESQTQRFQDQNRKIALEILKAKLWQLQETKKEEEKQKIKGDYKPAAWGNQIRSYVLQPYKLVKDLRTGWEEHDAESVLDGNLDGLIESELKSDI